MDLYARLGIKRGATDAEIKKAYRSLAKQLHPDANKDNPKAAERFSQVTAAYDLLSDKDKRARYDRGELDEDGNPKMPFGGGFGGAGGGYAGPRPGSAGFEGFGEAEGIDLSDLFEGMFSRGGAGGGAARGGGAGGFSGFGRRSAPQKGADVAYRLTVPFTDAVAQAPQRVTLRDGKTIDLKLPNGAEDGTKIRIAGRGDPGTGGNGDAIITLAIEAHRFFTRDGDDVRLTLPVTLKEAVLGAKVKVPTADGAVMLTIPKGSSSGKVLRIKGRGFAARSGQRGDQLVTLSVELPAADAALEQFVTGWDGGGNPRSGMGV